MDDFFRLKCKVAMFWKSTAGDASIKEGAE